MIIKQLTLATLDTGTLDFGFVGENEHIKYIIKCDSVFDEYPTATASLLIKAPDNTIYPKTVEVEGYNVGWVITASDTAYPGSGQIQLTFTEDGAVVKTVIANTNIKDSLVGDDPPPDPIADWISTANQILDKVDGLTATAESLPAGDDPSVTVETVDGHYNLEFGIPAGDPGDPTEIIDDNAGVGDVTKVWSANKSATELSELKSEIDGTSITHLIDFPTTELSASAANKTVYFKGNRFRQVAVGNTSTSYRYFTLCKGRILVNSTGADDDLSSLTADDFITLPETEGLYNIRLDLSIRNRNSAAGNNPNIFFVRYTDASMTTLEKFQLNPTSGATAVQDRTEVFENISVPGRKFVLLVTVRNNNNEFVGYINFEPTNPGRDTITVSGSTPSITGVSGKRYICGTVDSITITPPSTGIIDVVFTSGTTPTVLTASGVTWPGWFNPNSLSASTIYEINIMNGLGGVMEWQT